MSIITRKSLRENDTIKKNAKKRDAKSASPISGDYIITNVGNDNFVLTIHGDTHSMLGYFKGKTEACNAADTHANNTDKSIYLLTKFVTFTFIRKTK